MAGVFLSKGAYVVLFQGSSYRHLTQFSSSGRRSAVVLVRQECACVYPQYIHMYPSFWLAPRQPAGTST